MTFIPCHRKYIGHNYQCDIHVSAVDGGTLGYNDIKWTVAYLNVFCMAISFSMAWYKIVYSGKL